MSSSGAVRALTAVIQHELPPAIVEMRMELERARREVERARMTSEDLRAASISPYRTRTYTHGYSHCLTWREFAEDRVGQCEDLVGHMDAAVETLEHARDEALIAHGNEPLQLARPALIRATNRMYDAICQLDGNRSDDDDHSSVDETDDEDHSSVDETDDVE